MACIPKNKVIAFEKAVNGRKAEQATKLVTTPEKPPNIEISTVGKKLINVFIIPKKTLTKVSIIKKTTP